MPEKTFLYQQKSNRKQATRENGGIRIPIVRRLRSVEVDEPNSFLVFLNLNTQTRVPALSFNVVLTNTPWHLKIF